MIRVLTLLLTLVAAMPALAQGRASPAAREETTRLAVAVLGRICVLNLGDYNALLTAASPTGEFGFADVTPEVGEVLLKGREGFVRVLRRPGLGAVTLTVGKDGICSVWSEYADGQALQRYLLAMVEKGGLKGAAKLLALGARESEAGLITEYYLMPLDWLAKELGRRFSTDGTQPLALISSVSAPGRRPMEGLLSISRTMAGK